MALAALHVSLTVTERRTFGTAAWQVPSALAAGMAEQVMTGMVVSLTVKEVEQESLFPAASVAVTVKVGTATRRGGAARGVECARCRSLSQGDGAGGAARVADRDGAQDVWHGRLAGAIGAGRRDGRASDDWLGGVADGERGRAGIAVPGRVGGGDGEGRDSDAEGWGGPGRGVRPLPESESG